MRPPVLRTALLAGLLLTLGVAALTVDVPDVGVVRDQIAAAGPLAPFLFVATYAVVVPAPLPKSVLMVRVIPVMPFTVLNYACGVTVMRLRHFVVGTLVGIAPGTTAHVALGSVGAQLSLWVPVTVSVGLGLLSLLVGLNWKHLTYRNKHAQ